MTGYSLHVQRRQPPAAPQLRDTQQAFDSVAADYDGPRGNNPLIQDMRNEMWRCLDATFPNKQPLDRPWAAARGSMRCAWRILGIA
jgi:hypothetical protein